MNDRPRALAAWLALALALGLPSGTALAATPTNDEIGQPEIVPSIPYTNSQDTTDATSGGTDFNCAGDGHTVWYQYTATADQRLEANTFGSDFDTTLTVGTPDGAGGIAVVACNDDTNSLQSRVRWDATSATTYLFQVGSCCGDAGGNLVFSLDVAPPVVPVVLTLTVNSTGTVDRNGVATVGGTIACQGTDSVSFEGHLRQQTGRFLLNGDAYTGMECAADASPWELQFWTPDGRFGGGKAQLTLSAFACGDEECADINTQRTVTLRK